MNIQISEGTGTGPTKLAAFDAALNEAGIANYNLLQLSSIIPPGSRIIIADGKISEQPGDWGDKLYIVKADMRVDTPNVEAWAGIGWVQDKKSGQGLFVEHQGNNEKTVRRDITQTLQALMRRRRGLDFGAVHMKVAGITCTKHPVCALVVAVYQSVGWE